MMDQICRAIKIMDPDQQSPNSKALYRESSEALDSAQSFPPLAVADAHTSTTTLLRETDGSSKCRVLLIGELGAGKSIFINYLAHYFMGNLDSFVQGQRTTATKAQTAKSQKSMHRNKQVSARAKKRYASDQMLRNYI